MNFTHYIPFYRRNLRLAFPVVLSQIGQVTVSLVDNMMVGHVGTTELAASAFANSIFTIGMFFGMGITYGITPLVGKAFGNRETDNVVQWLKNGTFTLLIVTFALALIMFGGYFLLPFMGQPADVMELAGPYYLLLSASIIPFMLFFSLKQFFEGIGNTKIAMQITLISNAINVAVNYVLIFGKFGFPELGLIGAGIGTLVSRIFMPLLYIIYIVWIPQFRRYFTLARLQAYSKERILSVLKIGIPIGFQLIVEVLTFSIGAVMMGWLGESPLAAHQVALGLASFPYMISVGISQAATIRVSHQMGRNDFHSLRMAAFASMHLVVVFMFVMGLIFVIGRNILPLMFTTDPHVVSITAQLLIVAAIFQVFDGLQVVMLSSLRGMADVKIPMLIAFGAYMLIGIPTCYALTFLLDFGPQGIWFGYLTGLGVAGIFFYFRFKYNVRERA
ncbi:MATE family efflux transporter [Mariniphaga sediminis]|uniref:MATE family efflux transporter n=1 Tax=Mariniphaga sediminis TaxID=1628158 RepID=UPI001559950C|nr:MATE family efflux transporter [Mariniphaga sediminis]